jgi:predicted extracellular nuclease
MRSSHATARAKARLASVGGLLLAMLVAVVGSATSPAFASFTPNPYTQTFDSLVSSSSAAWTDNSTLPLWYSNRTTYNAGTGTSTTGALYSFGTTGDRALGGVASGGTNTILFGVQLTNTTGAPISELAVSYEGEQWRTGGSSTTTPSVAQQLDFQYQVGATSLTAGTWTDVNALDFVSPIFGTTAAAALDGNAAANRTALSATIPVAIDPGATVWLRWQDINDANNDHGLAVDDLSVTALADSPQPLVINEFSASTTGNDVEYIELFGEPSTDYSAYTLLEIEGDVSGAVTGTVDGVFAVGATNASGFWLASLANGDLENGTVTLLLVEGFSGALGNDLDTNEDGAFDVTPWTAIVDAVAVNDGGAGDLTYGVPVLGVAYDGQPFAPGGASRIPDGADSDTATDWVRNDFDLAGIPGFAGTPVAGEALNTPGAPNQAITSETVTVTIAAPDGDAAEAGSATGTLRISRTGSTAAALTVNYTVSGTASAGDYTPALGSSVEIPAGSTFVDIVITPVNDSDAEGPETLTLTLAAGTGYLLGASTSASITIVDDDAATVVTPISAIQGTGSAVASGTFTVEAIVVGDYQTQGSGQLRGFFIQEENADSDGNSASSEGIFVFCSACPVPVSVGDKVRVTGATSDFNGMSQLTASTAGSVSVLSSGNQLPAPGSLELPVPGVPSGDLAAATAAVNAYFEAFEGMLVSFPDTLSVSEYFELARYGQVILNEGGRPYQFTHDNLPTAAGFIDHQIDLARRTIILDDTDNIQNRPITTTPNTNYYYPVPGLSTGNFFRGGDTITGLTGVLHWSFAGLTGTDAWRIRPVTESFSYAFTPANPRPSAPPAVGGSLKVASFNVLNYFLTIDTTASNDVGTCGPSGSQDCRGADSIQERELQRVKMLEALEGLDADVIGLMEMENTPGVEPLADIVAGLPGYAYIDTGVIGTDAIRVGIIYRTSTVQPVGDYAILDSSVDARFVDTRNRPALAQSFEENATGAIFTVAVNHLKSKGSGCGAGDDDTTTGQGNCNGTRTQAALALADWLAADPTGSGDPDVLIIGDLNSNAMEDPITALKNAGYTDLVAAFGGSQAYGYVFDGQLGYLDHALANSSLAPQVTGVADWHINADEIPLFDYNDTVRDPGERDAFEEESDTLPLYEPNAYRTSDHDPVIIGLGLTPPSPTPTITSTPSNTPTNTPTPSNTPTNTPIPSNTPTNTPTSSNTPTNTPIPSSTPTPSNTPTNTPTPTPTNAAPTITVGSGGVCLADFRGQLALAVGDSVTAANQLTLSATSSNTALVPVGNISFGGSGASRTVTIATVSGRSGSATITVTVSDGSATASTTITVIAGTNNDDTLNGTGGADMLFAGGAQDKLYGNGGNDLLCGGQGDDQLVGDAGDDSLDGGSGQDKLDGGQGDDQLSGGQGDDQLSGGQGQDRLTGGADADHFDGGVGNDTATDFDATQGDTKVSVP